MATYKNNATNEVYKLGGISNIGKAWSLSKFVCSRMGWNNDTFANDVTVSLN